jgi:hypothetical protein
MIVGICALLLTSSAQRGRLSQDLGRWDGEELQAEEPGQVMRVTGARGCVLPCIMGALPSHAPHQRHSGGSGCRQPSRQRPTENVIYDTIMYHLLLCN